MSAFTTPLKVSPVGDGRWKLLEEFPYYTDDHEWIVFVPKDFITDFASIPRVLWALYPPYSETHGKAAVVHDYLYATQKLHDTYTISRKWADQVFLEAMKVLGAGWFKRTVMYQSVRFFAGAAWASHRKRIEAEREARTVRDILNEKSK